MQSAERDEEAATIRSSRRRGSGAEEVEDVETVTDEVDQRLGGNQRLATENGVWRQGRDARRQGGQLGEQRRIELVERVVPRQQRVNERRRQRRLSGIRQQVVDRADEGLHPGVF